MCSFGVVTVYVAVPWFRRFVDCLSPRKPGFDYNPVDVGLGRQSGVVTDFSPTNTVFSYQYHSTTATYSALDAIDDS